MSTLSTDAVCGQQHPSGRWPVQPRQEPVPPGTLWTDPAIHTRDIAALFHWLHRHGVSQRRIAAATGQSQSEISEVLTAANPRRVGNYDVLVRIYEGLGIPRGWAGSTTLTSRLRQTHQPARGTPAPSTRLPT